MFTDTMQNKNQPEHINGFLARLLTEVKVFLNTELLTVLADLSSASDYQGENENVCDCSVLKWKFK